MPAPERSFAMRYAIVLNVFVLMPLYLLLWGCTQDNPPAASRTVNQQEPPMSSQPLTRTAPIAVAPIDTAAPERFQTATFGLG